MAAKTLEAKIVLSGTDDSGPAFDSAKKHAKSLESTLNGVAHSMRRTGLWLTATVTTPILLAAGKMVEETGKWQAAQSSLNAVLASMGPVAGRNAKQLIAQAEALERVSIFDKSEILGQVTDRLLTFGHVQGRVFDLAQKAVINLSSTPFFGGDMAKASLALGKALQEPVTGMQALRRIGVTFTEQQQRVIKSLITSGAAGAGFSAQMIILNEVMRKYGGQAAAATQSVTGSIQQLKNSVNSMLADFGAGHSGPMVALINRLHGMVDWFGHLSDNAKQWIVIAAGVAASVGPIMLATSFAISGFLKLASAVKWVTGLMVGLDIAAGPWIAVAAAIAAAAYIIYENWDKISALGGSFSRGFSASLSPETIKSASAAVTKLQQSAGHLWRELRPLAQALGDVGYNLAAISLRSFGVDIDNIAPKMKPLAEGFKLIGQALGGNTEAIVKIYTKAMGVLADVFDRMANSLETIHKYWIVISSGGNIDLGRFAGEMLNGGNRGPAGRGSHGYNVWDMSKLGYTAPMAPGAAGRRNALMGMFQKLGYSRDVAAAILGSAAIESAGTFSPGVRPGDSGTAHGIFQHRGARAAQFMAMFGHSFERGTPWEEARFVDWELKHGYRWVLDRMNASSTLWDKTWWFNRGFENPRDPTSTQMRRYKEALAARNAGGFVQSPGIFGPSGRDGGLLAGTLDINIRHDGVGVRQKVKGSLQVRTGIDNTGALQGG